MPWTWGVLCCKARMNGRRIRPLAGAMAQVRSQRKQLVAAGALHLCVLLAPGADPAPAHSEASGSHANPGMLRGERRWDCTARALPFPLLPRAQSLLMARPAENNWGPQVRCCPHVAGASPG